MDGILICLETVRQELVTKDNSTRADSTYPKFSAEFAENLKETLESEVREKNNTGFGLYTMNEEEKNSVQKSEIEGNGLLRRRKLSGSFGTQREFSSRNWTACQASAISHHRIIDAEWDKSEQ